MLYIPLYWRAYIRKLILESCSGYNGCIVFIAAVIRTDLSLIFPFMDTIEMIGMLFYSAKMLLTARRKCYSFELILISEFGMW